MSGTSWLRASSTGKGVDGAGRPKNGTDTPRASRRSDITASVPPPRRCRVSFSAVLCPLVNRPAG